MTSRLQQHSNQDYCTYSIHFPSSTDPVSLLPQVLTHLESLTSNYIWHNQPFNLSLSPLDFSAPPTQTQHRHLQGKVQVTDAVDDEWFIVHLLRQLSHQYPDAIVHVQDDDGEFLLIEAADHLPTWLTPQNAQNRVWLYRSNLHLIPLKHKSALPFSSSSTPSDTLNPSFDPDEDAFLDRTTALELIRDDKVETRAPKEVQEAVWARIAGYPDKIQEHHHRTLAYVPTDIALALAENPKLVAEAVKAFYEREPATLKACNSMTRFPPASPSNAFSADPAPSTSPSLPPVTLTPIVLTRPLYSQLVLQRFYAPKPFDKVKWDQGTQGAGGETAEKRWRSVGMKVACGFEMLYAQTSPQLRHPSASASDGTVTNVPAYQAFLGSLTEKGFFEGESEGSQGWKRREKEAREGWEKAKGERPTLSFAQRVDDSISLARSRPNPLPSRIPTLHSVLSLSPSELSEKGLEDTEDWMALDEQGLEELLRSRAGGGGGGGGGQLGDSDFESSDEEEEEEEEKEGEEEGMNGVEGAGEGRKTKDKEEEKRARKAARRLEKMAGKVEEFVQGRGAVQGALFEDEQTDDEASDDDEDGDETMAPPPPPLSAEERASRLEKLVAPLAAEEWGQKEPLAQQEEDEEGEGQDEAMTTTSAPPPLDESAVVAAVEGSEASKHPHRAPKFAEEKYDGFSSDDDSSSNSETNDGPRILDQLHGGEEGEDEEEEEDRPAVLAGQDGEGELDLGEEMDEFLRFATETLGLTPEQYEGILGERRERGAFVPAAPQPKKTNILPTTSSSKPSPSSTQKKAAPPSPSPAAATAAGRPPPAPAHAQARNPNLKDFDTLMEQMEKELAGAKQSSSSSSSKAKEKGEKASTNTSAGVTEKEPPSKPYGRRQDFPDGNRVVVDSLSDSEEDDEEGGAKGGPRGGGGGGDEDTAAMDAELASLLAAAGTRGFGGEGDGDGEGEGGEGGGMDYNLVKNFLQSFQAQGGFGGPAGNLAGRMGFNMPRDA